MKKLKFPLFILFISILALSACKKDDDDKNPCEDIVCQNNGTCVSGNCDCPIGFVGASCETILTPTAILIDTIAFSQFPQTDGSSSWDVGSGPDVYVAILRGTTLIHEQPTFFQDAINTEVYLYVPTTPIRINDPAGSTTFAIIDYDSGSNDDIMDAGTFTLFSKSEGFPEVLRMNLNPSIISIAVRYEF